MQFTGARQKPNTHGQHERPVWRAPKTPGAAGAPPAARRRQPASQPGNQATSQPANQKPGARELSKLEPEASGRHHGGAMNNSRSRAGARATSRGRHFRRLSVTLQTTSTTGAPIRQAHGGCAHN